MQQFLVVVEYLGVQLPHLFSHFIGRNRLSLPVLHGQGRIGKQSAADNDACQPGEACCDGLYIFRRMQISIVKQRFVAFLVEGLEAVQVYFSFVLLFSQAGMEDDVR